MTIATSWGSVGRFQIFLKLGCFGIWLTLDFVDLSQQKVCPGFAPCLVDLRRLQRDPLCVGQSMQRKVRASSIEISMGIAGRIKSKGSVGKAEHLFPSLIDRTKIRKAEIGRKIAGVNS
ncbi:MAG: hypothetical protein WB762_25305 [Candidatus Sulfotelmatobacter sp.]